MAHRLVSVPLLTVAIALTVGCNESPEQEDAVAAMGPEDAYAKLVAEVEMGNYGYMYDILDSAYKGFTAEMINRQLAQLEVLDSSERRRWAALGQARDTREAFAQLMEMSPEITGNYRGSFRILNVDTVISLTVQHAGHPPSVVYFKWQDGQLRFTPPPDAPARPAAERVVTPRDMAPEARQEAEGSPK